MKNKYISDAIGNISTRHILEAEQYMPPQEKTSIFKRPIGKYMIAAIFMLCFIMGESIYFSLNNNNMTVTAYSYGTNEQITPAGVTISTGTISDDGEMTGHPLMFYLSGKDIKSVRFSCKNQKIDFRDRTEKRDEYGEARNFTVEYGKNENDYGYLTIDWMPNDTIDELTENADSTIAALPAKMKEDIIVMEISFFNGKTTTKAITVSLQDNGKFHATFDNYEINYKDDFVNRPDSKAIPREILYYQGEDAPQVLESYFAGESTNHSESTSAPNEQSNTQAAENIAKAYYSNTVFELVSLEIKSQSTNKIVYWACVEKDGVVQEPNRSITLRFIDGKWKVTGEGY